MRVRAEKFNAFGCMPKTDNTLQGGALPCNGGVTETPNLADVMNKAGPESMEEEKNSENNPFSLFVRRIRHVRDPLGLGPAGGDLSPLPHDKDVGRSL